jgi:nicotinamidase-related amidase
MIQGAQILEVPILLTEQYPQGLGPTIPEIAELLDGMEPITKTAFSCCGEKKFNEAFASLGRRQALLMGIETHICVWQTVHDLLASKYEVHVAADAVSSRSPVNKEIGLNKIQHAGAKITCVETALFELMRVAEGPKFKAVSKILK